MDLIKKEIFRREARLADDTLRQWKLRGRFPKLFHRRGGRVFVDLDEWAKIEAFQQAEAENE